MQIIHFTDSFIHCFNNCQQFGFCLGFESLKNEFHLCSIVSLNENSNLFEIINQTPISNDFSIISFYLKNENEKGLLIFVSFFILVLFLKKKKIHLEFFQKKNRKFISINWNFQKSIFWKSNFNQHRWKNKVWNIFRKFISFILIHTYYFSKLKDFSVLEMICQILNFSI